jgi:hypothetical protein
MNTRKDMIEAVRAVEDTEFQDEVAYYMDLDREEDGYDEVSALFDIERLCDDWLRDAETAENRKAVRRLQKVAWRSLIAIGFYRVMPQEEIDSTVTSSGRQPWAFKLDGTAYTTDETVHDWQFPS